jgi:hypothetical protein
MCLKALLPKKITVKEMIRTNISNIFRAHPDFSKLDIIVNQVRRPRPSAIKVARKLIKIKITIVKYSFAISFVV